MGMIVGARQEPLAGLTCARALSGAVVEPPGKWYGPACWRWAPGRTQLPPRRPGGDFPGRSQGPGSAPEAGPCDTPRRRGGAADIPASHRSRAGLRAQHPVGRMSRTAVPTSP